MGGGDVRHSLDRAAIHGASGAPGKDADAIIDRVGMTSLLLAVLESVFAFADALLHLHEAA